MDKFVITGCNKLYGSVDISGAKNSAVAILPAALMVSGICRIENVPDIQDVRVIFELIKHFGAKIAKIDAHTYDIDSTNLTYDAAPYELACKLRASYYFIGALLGRFNKAEVPMPGGCNFGVRPIDQHIKGFKLLGADVDLNHGVISAHADSLKGGNVFLDMVSVGATINIMISATRAEGITVIENAAKEPHVVDVANFLNSMGANIRGAGTDVIKIKGVQELHSGTYSIIPDQIEAGTFMIAASCVGGDVVIKNIIPRHLEPITAKLLETGTEVEEFDDSIRVRRLSTLTSTNVKTLVYPGFPTDLQPLATTLLTIAEGNSKVTESVWENRFQYIDELRRMGADINVEGKTANIKGVEQLMGTHVEATDLRAGAALVIAGLMAKGVTEVHNIIYIDRGYESIESKFNGLGANIVRMTDN
ncbi:MAG: UDP-N-acetylglucosamine 1-carboxyvinyltransferase [Eubacteriales bacterium]|nr:UDP-N-acetylglucosamine 1-carboxyvinyltransferase [Eubacteriales bacterium]